MVQVYLGFGSNLGNGKKNIHNAWKALGAIPHIFLHKLSSPYISSPVNMISSHLFTNAVGLIETSYSPGSLLGRILQLETALGRDRTKGMDRIIDIDILFFDNQVVAEDNLTIPHPEVPNRLFVLEPMAEIAPHLNHPLLNQSISTLLENLQQLITDQDQYIEKTCWPTY